MKESYRKGVANHPDPEPCRGGRKAAPEALVLGHMQAGYPEVVNSEIAQSGRRRRHGDRKATLWRAVAQVRRRPCGVEDPTHA
jgi:hypothetical protein